VNLTYLAFRIAVALVPRLPPWLVVGLTYAAGWIAWLANVGGRRAVRANLRVVLGVEPTGAQVRTVFVTAAQNYCDLFCLPRLSEDDLAPRVDVEGWEHLARALAARRGALLASLHLGNIEVIGRAAELRGVEVVLPVERIEPPELLDLMLRLRRRAGLICEPVGDGAIDAIRAALKRNAVVGIGADRITLGSGEAVTFCGRSAQLPVAAAMLALRTGAPLLPCASQRLPGRRFRVRIGAPIPVARSGHARADVRLLTERLLTDLGVYLRANPTQWVIFRSIWKTECAD